jgi:hypothetical protein
MMIAGFAAEPLQLADGGAGIVLPPAVLENDVTPAQSAQGRIAGEMRLDAGEPAGVRSIVVVMAMMSRAV